MAADHLADHRPRPALALVGAGPRGTSVLERICASAAELAPGSRLTVHVIDPAPPGAGQVWRTAQPPELLMNTVASQVTLFTDDSVECAGPIRTGPSLYAWEGCEVGPDDYPGRALYGRYLEWVFRHTVRTAPEEVTVVTHPACAVRLAEAPDGSQSLTLDNGRTLHGLGAVVLAQGHLPAVADAEQRRLADYAAGHGLRYLPPANPADLSAALEALPPGRPVLLRGLGLNFFDHMALLTTARGGRFVRGAGGTLTYLPSGREPRLYAGSRRGVPYHARGDNAKGAHGRHLPLLLTPDVIAAFRKRADSGELPDFLAEVWPLVAKEVEAVYYEALLARRAADDAAGHLFRKRFRQRFLGSAHRSPEEAAALEAFGIAPGERWDWDRVSRPHAERSFAGRAAFREWLLDHLREDVAHARQDNVSGPVKAALDVLRDLRNELRQIVDHGGLAGASRRDHLDRWYTPLNAFLSIGPPRRRIEEMTALIEAGVLEVIGPRMTLRLGSADGHEPGFTAHSPDVPGSTVTATALIEARLPEPDVRRTADLLLARLLAEGGGRPHTVDGYETGGLDVTPSPYRLIEADGRHHPRRFAVGVPTEGVHWVTAAGARPGVGSVTLADTDAVARAALRAAVEGATPGRGTGAGRAPASGVGAGRGSASGVVPAAGVVSATGVATSSQRSHLARG
ncbi:FAD-NAD(P)-binding [Streptomyces sp. SceaMP-e96]|uniref:FAD/NAD(P)-binding protein n=1 Tax=unclassified Streptomyces TaxID=2593676 RepID=UPI00082381A7|nr:MULTISPECIES: FAD/NAD(P)-binding protein [unclassified Streptomyces]MYT12800.1 FAD-binding protein [Streptomyces sp. SID4951]SCK38705.1 FAD-NAD(P)-binding [Streptomyces sp. SceaMP-e96]